MRQRNSANFSSKRNNTDEQGVTVETVKPRNFVENGSRELKIMRLDKQKRIGWWKYLLLGLVLLVFTGLYIGYQFYASQFEAASGVTLKSVVTSIKEGRLINPFTDRQYKNFLIVGLDQIADQRDNSVLTDTLMIASIHKSGRIRLISIPRDLWIDSLKTKVNALYYYGEENKSTTGEELLKAAIEEIFGTELDYVLVLKMDIVKRLIDSIGGIDVEVQNSFVDTQFPRSDVDISAVTEPELLYETIRFDAGWNHFDGETALKFIRSRHSEDEVEGSDEGRTMRQQLVVKSLVESVMSPKIIKDPRLVGSVYRVFHEEFGPVIPDLDLVSMVTHLDTYQISIQSAQISITNDEAMGILMVPPIAKYNQWVYEPEDPTWLELQQWIRQQLE